MGIGPRELKCATFCTRNFFERLQMASTETFTAELMDVSRLWGLNKRKVEELIFLLVLVWSPRSEGWSSMKKLIKTVKISCIGMWPRMHFLDLQQLDHWLNSCTVMLGR